MRKMIVLYLLTFLLMGYTTAFSQWTYTNGPYGGSIQAYKTLGS